MNARTLSRRATESFVAKSGTASAPGRRNRPQKTVVSAEKRLGVDRERPVFGKVGASRVVAVLGPEWFAEVKVVRVPGKVVWCNFELARELGFDVPPSNLMTPEFQEQLLDALSYRVLEPAEDAAGRKTIKMYADRYSGEGVLPMLGAGRAAFLPYGNLCVKGIGLTPLFKCDDPVDDFEHAHGGLTMDEAIVEALFGEVNANLFTLGSARILAIIDEGEFITYPEGHKVPRVLMARAGMQLRPAHLLARRIKESGARLETFIRITRETGQLVTRKDTATSEEVADIRSTMLRVVDDHARTSAEQFRWRVIHGALSSSNMEMSGAMLDLATQSTQPRTAPIYVLPYPDSTYGREHIERAVQFQPIYRAILRSVSIEKRERLNAKPINLTFEMERAYQKYLQVKMLGATGLKAEVAERIQADHPDLACRFTEIVVKMAGLKNQGVVNAGKAPVAAVSVLDIFHLLQTYPAIYFAKRSADHTTEILAALRPIFKGNRFQIASRRAAVESLAREFATAYDELMRACESLATEYYDDHQSMREAIKARAAFENEPINLLYRVNVYKEFEQAVRAYKATGDTSVFRESIDRKVSASLRSVDALLAQGTSRRMSDGGFEVERRTIDGINYSVRAWNDERQTRRLHVSLTVVRDGDVYITSLPGNPRFSEWQIRSLRYRYTTNGWATSNEVRARLREDRRAHLIIDFEDIHTFPQIGRLAGVFCIRGRCDFGLCDRVTTFGEYTFAIPDQRELMQLTGRGARRRTSSAQF
jgi:hypothetical protein